MEKKSFWQNTSLHSFDMSEYIYGERFELGGVDFDDDSQKDTPTKKTERSSIERKRPLEEQG